MQRSGRAGRGIERRAGRGVCWHMLSGFGFAPSLRACLGQSLASSKLAP